MRTNAAAIASRECADRAYRQEHIFEEAIDTLREAVESIVAEGGPNQDALIAESVAQAKAHIEKSLSELDDDADDDEAKFRNMGRMERDVEDDDDDDEKAAANDHALSRLADLVAEANGTDRAAALRWLLHDNDGAAAARRHKREQETKMSKEKMIEAFKKKRLADLGAMSVVEVAKMALARPDENVLQIDEAEFTQLITAAAHKQHPDLTKEAAFTKVFAAQTADGALVRKAHAVVKAMPFTPPLPTQTHSPGAFQDAVSDTEQSEAYKQLQELGRQQWPTASEAQQFARAMTDPKNAALARKAHRQPTGHPSFPR